MYIAPDIRQPIVLSKWNFLLIKETDINYIITQKKSQTEIPKQGYTFL